MQSTLDSLNAAAPFTAFTSTYWFPVMTGLFFVGATPFLCKRNGPNIYFAAISGGAAVMAFMFIGVLSTPLIGYNLKAPLIASLVDSPNLHVSTIVGANGGKTTTLSVPDCTSISSAFGVKETVTISGPTVTLTEWERAFVERALQSANLGEHASHNVAMLTGAQTPPGALR